MTEKDYKELIRKAVGFLKENRGGFVLTAITLLLTLLAAIVADASGACYTTTVVTAQCFGILGILTISALFKIEDMDAPMGSEWGVLGTIAGIFLVMCLF